jgi:hypothetical protein
VQSESVAAAAGRRRGATASEGGLCGSGSGDMTVTVAGFGEGARDLCVLDNLLSLIFSNSRHLIPVLVSWRT